jgi:hypothetical protein
MKIIKKPNPMVPVSPKQGRKKGQSDQKELMRTATPSLVAGVGECHSCCSQLGDESDVKKVILPPSPWCKDDLHIDIKEVPRRKGTSGGPGSGESAVGTGPRPNEAED